MISHQHGLTALLAAATLASTGLAAPSDPVTDVLDVSQYEVERLVVPLVPDSNALIRVELEGQPVTLLLQQSSLRAADFQVLVQDESGFSVFDAPEPSTFSGEVLEMPGSRVNGSILGGQLHAAIVTDFGAWGVQPLSLGVPSADSDLHVVYSQADIIDRGYSCGVADGLPPVTGEPGTYGTGLALTEIGVDADVEYFNDNGGSVVNTINDIELIIGNMTAIYEADVDITFEITTIVVRTAEPDPYSTTNPSSLLGQLDSEWSNNLSFIRRDVAHLMTGKNIDGGVIGIAYLNAICSQSQGYGLSESTFTSNLVSRVGLTAHEVGHNYGASHCNGTPNGACRIMCATLGGCNNNLTSFGLMSRTSITNFSNGLGCTPELGDPISLPFFDGFVGTSIDRDRWPVFQGAATSTSGVGEPSGTRSLNLDAVNGNDYADDFIRSNVILMGGATGQQLSFFSEHRGVEAGEKLVVEYLNSSDDWVFLGEIISTGSDQSSYVLNEYALPGDAYHDGFRFSFRTEVNNSGDEWYIDDVSVDDSVLCPPPVTYCTSTPNSFSPVGSSIGSLGSNSVGANDFILTGSLAAVNQVGIFYYGPTQTQVAFGNGFRCISGSTVRLPVITTDAFGYAQYALDLNNLPAGSTIDAGDTVNFQFWFRDPAAGGAAFNLSNGLAVTWCP